jgi:signal transduction histidine kinase
MHEQPDELLAARDQTEELLRVVVEIGSDLDLDATLHRVISAAMTVTGARYGALGVHGADGTLVSFLHDGIDDETVRRIGHLPAGEGVLGLLLDRPETLRCDDLTAHPAAVGFPEHHPRMRAFLGVPIRVRGEVFGSLYLTDDRPAKQFTDSDEIAARALASAAGVAIDNAKLFERVCASAKWTEASREITTALLSGEPHVNPLQLIAERARELIEAEQAIVLVASDDEVPSEHIDTLVISTAVGLHSADVLGQTVPIEGSTTGSVYLSGTPVITDSFRHPIQAFTDVGQRPAIVMPLSAGDAVIGVMAVARNAHQQPFGHSHLELMSDFADHAAMALTLAASREQAREVSILADRERIAHDLHDHVIQKLFAAGMDLQGSIARARSPELEARLSRTVDDLQTTINDIRSTIFKLQPPAGHTGGFQQRMQRAVRDLTENRDIATSLYISGPMSVVGSDLAEQAEAVVIEAVSNTVRHSGASSLIVEIAVDDHLTIQIVDDGCGIPADNKRRSGLVNLQRRAEQVGGRCRITSPPASGTRVHWTAPLIGL